MKKLMLLSGVFAFGLILSGFIHSPLRMDAISALVTARTEFSSVNIAAAILRIREKSAKVQAVKSEEHLPVHQHPM